MRLGIPVWRDEVSPVFDVASTLLVIDAEAGREISRHVRSLGTLHGQRRAGCLAAAGLDLLVCGVITRPLERMVTVAGVRVISLLCGPVEEVARSIISGAPFRSECLMPGHGQPRVRGRAVGRRSCAHVS
jgi:predicted Fe-Mo cluster-binding NifX family protein